MNSKLEAIAWGLVSDCGSPKEFIASMKLLTSEDISEDCLEIWNQYWSKEQPECPDCDY